MEQVIREIAERIGLEAARVWPQVVMVTWITSLFWVVVDPILVIGAVVGEIVLLLRTLREVRSQRAAYEAARDGPGGYLVFRSDYDCFGWITWCAAVSFALVVVAFLALVAFPDQLAGVLYPEAVTVLHLAKGK